MCSLLAKADDPLVEKLHITNRYFTDFDKNSWTVNRRWKNDKPGNLKSRVSCYSRKITERMNEEFEKEVNQWFEKEILVPWTDTVKATPPREKACSQKQGTWQTSEIVDRAPKKCNYYPDAIFK